MNTNQRKELRNCDKRSLGRRNQIVLSDYSNDFIMNVWTLQSSQVSLQHNQNQLPIQIDDCWIYQGSQQNGYPALSCGHAKSKIKLHIVAAWIRYNEIPSSSQVVSHLCHQKLCINPSHLTIERISCNNARKGCLCRLILPNCQVWNLCSHQPLCIMPDDCSVGSFKPYRIA